MLFDSTVCVFVLTVVGAADYTCLPKLKSTWKCKLGPLLRQHFYPTNHTVCLCVSVCCRMATRSVYWSVFLFVYFSPGEALQTGVAPGTMRQQAWPERAEKSPFITLNQAGQRKKCTQKQQQQQKQRMPQQRRSNTHIWEYSGEQMGKAGRDWARAVSYSDCVILNGKVDWATLRGSDVLVNTLSSVRGSLLEITNQSPAPVRPRSWGAEEKQSRGRERETEKEIETVTGPHAGA